MKYENFAEAEKVVKEIGKLNEKLGHYLDPKTYVKIGGIFNFSEVTYPLESKEDAGIFDKAAKEMLNILAFETKVEIKKLEAHLETL